MLIQVRKMNIKYAARARARGPAERARRRGRPLARAPPLARRRGRGDAPPARGAVLVDRLRRTALRGARRRVS